MTTKRFAIAIPSAFTSTDGKPTPDFHIMNIISGDMPQFEGKNRTLISKKFCEMSGFELDKKYFVEITQGYDYASKVSGQINPSITFTKVSEVSFKEMREAIVDTPVSPYTLTLIGENKEELEAKNALTDTGALEQ